MNKAGGRRLWRQRIRLRKQVPLEIGGSRIEIANDKIAGVMFCGLK